MVYHHLLTRFRGHDAAPQAGEGVGLSASGFLDGEEYRLILGAQHIEVALDDNLDGRVVYSDSGG